MTPVPSRNTKLVNFLTTNRDAFTDFVRAIRARDLPLTHELRRTLFSILPNRPSPEKLIWTMCMCMGDDLTWDVMVESLTCLKPAFKVNDLHDANFEDLLPLLRINKELAVVALTDLLEALNADELQRVRVFLQWELFEGYGHVPYGMTQTMGPYKLAFAVNAAYSHKAAFVMGVILEQIGRIDLVLKLRHVADDDNDNATIHT